ncbi:MAG: hypothetical protein HDR44_01905 [Allobaculum sp.]|nr:hypothetical protein [Allobaculum sp.]
MFTPKALPPTRPIPLRVELNQDQLYKTTFQTLPSSSSSPIPSLANVQDIYLVKDFFSLPSRLSFTYHQALHLLFSQAEDFRFQDSFQEEVEAPKESDIPLILDLDKETDPSSLKDSLYPEENQDIQEEDLLSPIEEDDDLTLFNPSQTFEEQEPNENSNEENNDCLENLVSPSNASQEDLIPSDASFDSSSCLQLSFNQRKPLTTSTKQVTLKFEEDMSGYFLNIKQDQSIQTIPLNGSIQSLSFREDQVTLTLFNDQNEPISSWTVNYQSFPDDQEPQPFVQIPVQDQMALTSTTLVPPIVVDDHITPFGISAFQAIPSQGKLILDSGYEPLVIGNQEEISKSALTSTISSPRMSATISSSSSLSSPSSAHSSTPSLSSNPIQPSSSISSVSSNLSASDLLSLPSYTIPLSSLSPSLASTTNSSALDSPSLPLEVTHVSTPSSSLSSTGLKTETYVPQMPTLDQLAYPPTDLGNSVDSSLNLSSNKLERLSTDSNPQEEKKSHSLLFKPLVKELQQQATMPLATVQQAGQSLSQGNTLYVKDPKEVQVHVENGTLQEIKVFSKDSKKTYTSLEMAMEAEKQATFEMEANVKSTHSDQMSQSKWTIIPLGETVEQSISLPAQDIKAFYTLEEDGKLSSYRQPSKPANALLCRGFEPLATQSVYPGESLRVYVEEEGDYTLSINGKSQIVSLQQDELGQPFIPVSVGALKTDIALQKDGTTIYSQSLQTNNPMVRLGWMAPVIGSLVGIILDVRRRKWL